MVDCVVEEEDLRGLDEEARERDESRVNECLDTGAEGVRDRGDNRRNSEECTDCEETTDDTRREVVDEHFETGANLAGPECVNLLDEPSTEGSDDHCAHEHGDRGSDDDTHRSDDTHDTTASTVDETSTGVCDEQREHVNDHGADHREEVKSTLFDGSTKAGDPAGGDEEGRDEAPGDKRRDVGHNHAREEGSKLLNPYS